MVQSRLWFNAANESRYFLVPGLIVLIMTLIGAFLTSLVMAREWERGTMEALFVTPVRPDEILLGKTIPYFVLGMIGLTLCLAAAKFLFHVPFRGSVSVLIGVSMLYLLVALAIGLLISSAIKSQFVASQIALAGHLSAGVDALGISFRSAQHAGRGPRDYLHLTGPVLRDFAADPFFGGRHLEGHCSECSGAGRHGGCVVCSNSKGHSKEARLRCDMFDALFRILALTRKELLAILKDPRSRFSILIPPILQCLIYGYVATYDLNDVPYAVLDQDRSAASQKLLAALDGSGVFRRVANLNRAADVKTTINDRRALLVMQIDQDFERRFSPASKPTCK